MSDSTFTPEQRAELEAMVEAAVHAAVAPIARQTTAWLLEERKRLTDPRRRWTGAPIGRRRPARATPTESSDPTPLEPPPPLEPEVHTFDRTPRED